MTHHKVRLLNIFVAALSHTHTHKCEIVSEVDLQNLVFVFKPHETLDIVKAKTGWSNQKWSKKYLESHEMGLEGYRVVNLGSGKKYSPL